MGKITFERLAKIAMGGLVLFPISGYIGRWHLQGKISSSKSYKEVMECVRSHDGAKKLLGEPIKDGRVDVGQIKYFGGDENKKWITIPVHGPNAHGYVKYWLRISGENYEISKIRLTLNDSSEKIVLFNKTEEANSVK